MIRTQLQRDTTRGNAFFVSIPAEEVERLGLTEGQSVWMHLAPVDVPNALSSDLHLAVDELDPRLKPATDHLSGR